MALTKINALLDKNITPKKWVKLTAEFDKLEAHELAKAMELISTASAHWPHEIDPAYYSPILPPDRMAKARANMEVRVCPKPWIAEVFAGQNHAKFSMLRVLMPHGNDRIKSSHLMNLLDVSHMQELHYLLLDQVKISAKFFKALKKEHNLMSLTHLRLWYCDSKSMSMSLLKAVLDANLPSLRFLHVGQNYMGPEAGAVFAKAKGLSSLRMLELPNNGLTVEGVRALCGASFFSELESLNLGLNKLGDEGIEILINAAPQNLQKLVLESNGITDEGVDALSQSALMTTLHTLDLRHNEISKEALARLHKAHPKLMRI